jgi:hypothetical protein
VDLAVLVAEGVLAAVGHREGPRPTEGLVYLHDRLHAGIDDHRIALRLAGVEPRLPPQTAVEEEGHPLVGAVGKRHLDCARRLRLRLGDGEPG